MISKNSQEIKLPSIDLCLLIHVGWTGNFKNLVVIISVFKPSVHCFGSIQPLQETKQALIDTIPTNFDTQTFGPLGKGRVDVVLPKTFSIPPVHRK